MPKTPEQTVADLEARIKDVGADLKAKQDRLKDRIFRGLDAYLTRPHDREAFDLDPLPEAGE